MERATRLELATFSLGIKPTAPLFSILTKPLNENRRACNAYRACSDLRIAWGRLGGAVQPDVFHEFVLGGFRTRETAGESWWLWRLVSKAFPTLKRLSLSIIY